MNNKKFPRGIKVYLPLIFMFILFVFMLPRTPRFNYEYKRGDKWKYDDLVAEFDFPILKTEQELEEELEYTRKNKFPYFIQDSDQTPEKVINDLDKLRDTKYASLIPQIDSLLNTIYSHGVFDPSDAQVYRNSPQGRVYVCKKEKLDTIPLPEIYTKDKALDLLKKSFKQMVKNTKQPGFLFDIDVQVSAEKIFQTLELKRLIVPNMRYSQKMTDELHREAIYSVTSTRDYINRSYVIVRKDQVINDDIMNLLDSYKAEYKRTVEYSGTDFMLWSGLSLMSLALVVLLFFTLYFCNYKIFREYNKYLYVLLLYTLFTLITFIVAKKNIEIYYLIPYSLMSMFMMAFFRRSFVMVMYVITLLPLLVVSSGNVDVFFMQLMAGFIGLYVYHTLNKGWLQFVGSFIIYLIMLVVWISFCLIYDNVGHWHLVLYIALSAGLAIAGYPLIYLFERVFMLVSSAKLVDLSDTSNPLLRQLADKAPGTFHHSLQVMNIADAAARSINANVPLIRAAALYHDIGKITNPQCFTENEIPGIKIHDGLTPKQSALIITRHVTDGLALAEKHNLPKVLKDFIISHHGTTSASYFLTKYLNDGGDPNDVKEFYYAGVKPATKEQVILMLSDAVEAASRSLKDYSSESISKLVDKIFEAKEAEGQMTDSDITLRELNTIKEVMKKFLQQIYHSRIEYPKRLGEVKK